MTRSKMIDELQDIEKKLDFILKKAPKTVREEITLLEVWRDVKEIVGREQAETGGIIDD